MEAYFSISFIRLVQMNFPVSRKSIFLVRATLPPVGTITGISSKQSKKELYSWLSTTDFLVSENHFFPIFKRLPVIFFRLVEMSFLNEILIWKQKVETSWLVGMDCLLVKAHFFCSEVFASSGNCHCN